MEALQIAEQATIAGPGLVSGRRRLETTNSRQTAWSSRLVCAPSTGLRTTVVVINAVVNRRRVARGAWRLELRPPPTA